MDISIVVPCYREQRYVKRTLKDLKVVLGKITNEYEIICVVDGIVDDTFEIIRKIYRKDPAHIRAVGYIKNRGKGFALRLGFGMAQGETIGFIDADEQIAPEAIARAIRCLKAKNMDLVVGSKAHRDSNVSYTPFRAIVSKLSQFYIKWIFDIGVSDTQAGLKVFRKEVVKTLTPCLRVNRFGFDIELLAASKKFGFDKIGEIPIKVKMLREDNTGANLVLFIKDVFRTFLELGPVLYRLRTGYYSFGGKSKWGSSDKPEIIGV
jgi:dolichol-phosphate mannosyltransferase